MPRVPFGDPLLSSDSDATVWTALRGSAVGAAAAVVGAGGTTLRRLRGWA